MHKNEDKENLYEIGTEENDDIPVMQKSPDENAAAFVRAYHLRKKNPLKPVRSLPEEAALRSQSPFSPHQSAPELEGVDLSRFDERLRNTVR